MSDLVLAVTHKHLVFNVLRSKLSSRSAQLAGSLLLSVTGILDVTGVAFGESPRSVAAVSAPAGREAVVLEGSCPRRERRASDGLSLVSIFGAQGERRPGIC